MVKSLLLCSHKVDCCSFFFPKGYTASLVGIGDSHPENLNRLLHLPLALVPPESGDEFEIKDIEIANVPVRIYKPKHLSTDADKKLTGVVYLHGGGWMLGSVGELKFFGHYHLLHSGGSLDDLHLSFPVPCLPVFTFPWLLVSLFVIFLVAKYFAML